MSRKPQPDLQVGIVHVKSERRLDKILALVSRLATNRVGVSARFDDLHVKLHALHFACSVAFRPSKGPATDSKTPESTPCPPPGQTTRHNNHDHVAYFSTVAPGLGLDRRQQAPVVSRCSGENVVALDIGELLKWTSVATHRAGTSR